MDWTMWVGAAVGLFFTEWWLGARLRFHNLAGAALTVALLTGVGLLPEGLPQLAAFFVLTTLGSLKLRVHGWARVVSRGRQVEGAAFVGETVVAHGSIAPGKRGPGQIDGTVWSVRNVGDEPVQPGALAMVDRVDGLVLDVLTPGAVRNRRIHGSGPVGGMMNEPATEGADSSDASGDGRGAD